MDVSIIILNYNTFNYTCQCVESVIEHTKGITYEIILVDNASKECNPDLFKEKFPFIQLIKSDANLGFSKGCNLGLSIAKGKTFLLLNSDTKLIENSLKICYNELMKEKTVMVIAPKTLNVNGSLQPTCEVFPNITCELIYLFRLTKFLTKKVKQKYLGYSHYNYDIMFYPYWIHGCFLLFKTESLGLFPHNKLPETFFMYGEDMEYGLIIYRKGYKFKYIPNTKYIHYGQVSTSLNNPNVNHIKSSSLFLKKYYGSYKARSILFLRGLKQLSDFKFRFTVKFLKEIFN